MSPVADSPPAAPTLSVVVPVYNEESTLLEVFERIRAVPIDKEIILVDDRSTDRSPELLDQLGEQPGVRVLRHAENRGKGAALKTGFAAVRGELVIVQDADLEYHPEDYLKIVAPILEGRVDVVYGSRFLPDPEDPSRDRALLHTLGNRVLTWWSNRFTGLGLTDMETCYKCFRREVVKRIDIRARRFTVEPEITSQLARLGVRVQEVPIRYDPRRYAEGKKITWRDGIAALWAIARYR